MTSLNHLTFTKTTKSHLTIKDTVIKYNQCEIAEMPQELERRLENSNIVSVGIDPGKNFGLAILSKDFNSILNGVLDDSVFTLKELAFWLAGRIAVIRPDITLAVIEGASYGDRFGQVKLAEIRCGFSLGFSESGIKVITVAPKTPRKVVFGSGDIGAMDVWMSINHNASDALCLAMYPFYKEVL